MGAIPQNVWVVTNLSRFVKHKNDMNVPAALATGCLIFELSKLRFRAHNYYLMGLFKRG